MSYKLVYSPLALEDLDQIWSEVWMASCDFDTADHYIYGLRESLRKKAGHPKTGIPLTYEGAFTGVYMVPFKAYLAFYRIHGNTVEVGRILYAKSDYMKTLFGRSEFIPEDEDG